MSGVEVVDVQIWTWLKSCLLTIIIDDKKINVGWSFSQL